MTYPKEMSWWQEALLHAQIARDYADLADESAAPAEETFPAQAEAVLGYPCGCPEVCDVTEEMLDAALRKVLLGLMAVQLRRRVEALG